MPGITIRAVGFFREHPELLAGFREGRREVLERVYRAYVLLVERYLRALAYRGGNPDLAQPAALCDLLQETFVRAFAPEARRRYDGVRLYGAYLATIAHHSFVDALRLLGRETPEEPEVLSRGLDEIVPPEEIRDVKLLGVLNAFLGELPAQLRELCEQRFVLGRSQEEVSAALGLSRGTLRTDEQRLRRGLRKALRKAGIALEELDPQAEDSATRTAVRAVITRGAG
jgi:RNA polymerase sigma factor (sigma-70 family)